MKRYMVVLFLFVILLCGCESRKKEEVNNNNEGSKVNMDIDIDLPSGKFQIVCTKNTTTKDEDSFTSIETAVYDNDQLLIGRKVKSIDKYKDKEHYDKFKEDYERISNEDTDDMKFKTQAYDDELIYIRVTAQVKVDRSLYGDDLQESLTAKYFLTVHEKENCKCEIIGASRSDLGL